jgi:Tfp pilus assembly protein PilN
MGLATLISALAFFIAMLALWLTSDIVKKVENQNEKFLRAHVATLRDEMREMDKMLHKTARLAQQMEQGQVALAEGRTEHATALRALQDRMILITAKLEDLDQSIPQRYRVKPLKADLKMGQKASIQ